MLLLLFLINDVLSNVIIFGLDDNLHQVTNTKDCKYPDDCYDNMIILSSLDNVTYISLIPIDTLNCTLEFNSTDDIYMIFGMNTSYSSDPNSYQLVDSLWNTLIPICDIWNIPDVITILVTHIIF